MNDLLTFVTYLVYGLVFFAIFFAISFRDLNSSNIAIARALPTLALFGLVHGLHEWSELYWQLFPHKTQSPLWQWLLISKLLVSYLLLALFAWKMLPLADAPWHRSLRWLGYGIALLFSASLFWRWGLHSQQQYLLDTALQIRWAIGFGASVIAGAALYRYAQQLEHDGHGAALPFRLMGLAIIGYGITAGLLPAHLGPWVLLVRTLSAAAILVALWFALRIFDVEKKRQWLQSQQQLHQGVKLQELGELTSAVAHEIKTPLSSAMMSCDLLQRQLGDNRNAQRQLDRIRTALHRAADISQEVLSYAHQRPLQSQPFAIAQLVESALSLNQYRLADFAVTISLEPDLHTAADFGQLEQVLSNLIGNAIDASSSQRQIAISAYRQQLDLLITIKDSGDGIDEPLLNKVMTPFFTTKPKGEGTGMGLALSKQIVQQHGGSLTLENHHNPQGVIATIRLPRTLT